MSNKDTEYQNQLDAVNYINWINKQDLFLVKDFLVAFDIERTEPRASKEIFTMTLLKILRDAGYIQCSGKKGSFVQYITIKAIPNDYSDRFKAEKRLQKFVKSMNQKK